MRDTQVEMTRVWKFPRGSRTTFPEGAFIESHTPVAQNARSHGRDYTCLGREDRVARLTGKIVVCHSRTLEIEQALASKLTLANSKKVSGREWNGVNGTGCGERCVYVCVSKLCSGVRLFSFTSDMFKRWQAGIPGKRKVFLWIATGTDLAFWP